MVKALRHGETRIRPGKPFPHWPYQASVENRGYDAQLALTIGRDSQTATWEMLGMLMAEIQKFVVRWIEADAVPSFNIAFQWRQTKVDGTLRVSKTVRRGDRNNSS